MLEHLTQNWIVRKPVAHSRRGIVAAQSRIAAEAGAGVLAAGGNAVDAAVATGFALAVAEPWYSGLGGVGYMLIYIARENRVEVVDFAPVSPRALDPKDFPLTGRERHGPFAWPQVEDDRNVRGPLSFAVPGQVDGLGLALERFGTRSLAELLQPAINLAEAGIPVDWYLTLKVATMAAELARYPATRDVWLPSGLPPVSPPDAPPRRLEQKGLADTLRRLAHAGSRDFYEGEIAARIVRDSKALGGVLEVEDLIQYRARIAAPLEFDYRGATFALAPGLTAGPSMVGALRGLSAQQFRPGAPDADAFVAYATVLHKAYEERLQGMGDSSDRRDPSSTTHFNVVDNEGNMVAVTQTLLSVFGSKVVLPSTGILMNNGVMWFDPRHGRPNSIGPNKRPLTNMCPLIVRRGANPWFALGASGGRKIFPAVLQIASFLVDHRLSLEEAFHQPRIDASGRDSVGVDPRLAPPILEVLSRRYPVNATELLVFPTNFACPSAVLVDPETGERHGASDLMSPWSSAVAESE